MLNVRFISIAMSASHVSNLWIILVLFTCDIFNLVVITFYLISHVTLMVWHNNNSHFTFRHFVFSTCDFCFHDDIFCRVSIYLLWPCLCVSNMIFDLCLYTTIQFLLHLNRIQILLWYLFIACLHVTLYRFMSSRCDILFRARFSFLYPFLIQLDDCMLKLFLYALLSSYYVVFVYMQFAIRFICGIK